MCHRPDLRMVIAGYGAETTALTRLSLAYGVQVLVLSPDPATVEAATAMGADAWRLTPNGPSPHLVTDRHAAVVLLFHDHERKLDLLAQALEQEALFIGAMGSRSTHRNRLAALRARGIAEERLAAIVGPVGLIPATRDPVTLALSVLSEIFARYEAALVDAAEKQRAQRRLSNVIGGSRIRLPVAL